MYIAVSTVHSKMSCRHCSHLTNVSFVTFLSYCPSDTKLTQLCNILPVPLDTLPIVLPPSSSNWHKTHTGVQHLTCALGHTPHCTAPSSSNWHKANTGVQHLTCTLRHTPHTCVQHLTCTLGHTPHTGVQHLTCTLRHTPHCTASFNLRLTQSSHNCATSYLYPWTHSPHRCATSYLYPQTHSPFSCPPSSSNWHKTHAGVHLTVPSDTLPTQVYNILPVLSHSPHRCATSYLYPRTHSPLYCPPQCQTETQQTKDYVQPVLPWQTLPGRTWHC